MDLTMGTVKKALSACFGDAVDISVPFPHSKLASEMLALDSFLFLKARKQFIKECVAACVARISGPEPVTESAS